MAMALSYRGNGYSAEVDVPRVAWYRQVGRLSEEYKANVAVILTWVTRPMRRLVSLRAHVIA
jgi:hypothetical protein